MEENLKHLLIKDLCARLPHGVKVYYQNLELPFILFEVNLKGEVLTLTDDTQTNYFVQYVQNSKPYLRPMSSMTEKEKETYYNLCYEEEREEYEFGEWAARVYYHDTIDSIDYLNSIHVDYRGLIPKGLAIAITKENNPYKTIKYE